jgi:hypothetical protein
MVAGLTIGKNTGGLNSNAATVTGQSLGNGNDLNDPNFTTYTNGIVGNDSDLAFRLSGSYRLPWDLSAAATLVSNRGYPYISTYTVTRALAAAAGVALTRANQVVVLSQRGDERLDAVNLVDLRISRAFRFSQRRIEPQIDIFNLTNANVADAVNVGVGSNYATPSTIVAPRIIRIGVSVNF